MSAAPIDPSLPHRPPEHEAPAARVPAGEFFSDAGARVVWAAVEGLEEGQKHALLELLASELAVPEARSGEHARRQARAVSALREAFRIHQERGGEALRQEDYRSLRAEIGEERGWPADASIRRWLGGAWNDALRTAMLPAAPDGDAIVRELGPEYTREDCVKAIQDYIADTGNPLPGLHSVINWARRRDVRARPGRRPRAQGPYDRLFASWSEALAAAGVVAADSSTGDAIAGGPGGPSRPPRAARYRDEQVRAALREVAHLLGRSPKSGEYMHLRQRIFERERAQGKPPRAMPSFSLINQRYGSWDAALIDAGLEPANGRQNARRSAEPKPPLYTREQLVGWIAQAFDELGHPFTSTAFIKWRAQALEAEREAGRFTRIPDYGVIYRRLGSWAAACELAGVPRRDHR
jgi:hypothetical protein